MKYRGRNASTLQEAPDRGLLQRRAPELAFVLALIIGALVLYAPALRGGFVLDDLSLPLRPTASQQALRFWLSGLRPALMSSYWLNFRLFGDEPVAYHAVNLVIHLLNSGLVFLVLMRLLTMAGWADSKKKIAAGIGTVVFLIHPLQTESVSYIAGRSESLASFFLLSAYAVFLYRRRESIPWLESIAVLFLFGLALATKENAVSLAGILILTDLMWPKAFSLEGLRRNWRLYLLMLPGAVFGAAAVLRMLAAAPTAGFSVNTFKWYQYAFTEARAIFSYIRLALLPIGQSLDHDFSTSHTIFEHGAIFYMALLAGSVVAVVLLRRRYPLAGFGWLMFLTWLAPTSSVIPIDDALVERRMYLPLLGLILIGCEVVNRLKLKGPAIGVLVTLIVFVAGGFCRARNQLWGKPETLLAAAAMEAKNNPRPLLNVAELMIRHNRCDLAVSLLQRAQRIIPDSYYVNASWGRTLACLGHPEEGMQYLQKAAQMQPSSQVYEWIGLVYGKMGKLTDAGAAFQKAVQLDPQRASAHNALALWYEHIRDLESAEREYKKSLALDPENWEARSSLVRVVQLKETTRAREAGEP